MPVLENALVMLLFFFFQAEDGIRDRNVTGVQTCALPISGSVSAIRVLQIQIPYQIYELAGPRIYTYRALLRALAAAASNRPLLLPLPFALWHAIGYVAEFLPSPPITRNQVELMEGDSVAAPGAPGFGVPQIAPRAIEDTLPEVLHPAVNFRD